MNQKIAANWPMPSETMTSTYRMSGSTCSTVAGALDRPSSGVVWYAIPRMIARIAIARIHLAAREIRNLV